MASGIYRQVYTSREKKKHICYDRHILIPKVTPLSRTLIQIRSIDLINNFLLKQISLPPRENIIKRIAPYDYRDICMQGPTQKHKINN